MTSRLRRFKDPKIIGPGVWWMGHQSCADAVKSGTYEDYVDAYKTLHKIRTKFPCGTCVAHIEEYCSHKPLEFYKPDPTKAHDAKGLALWFYELHNNANRFTGNESEDYENVETFFETEEGFCEEDCGEAVSKGDGPPAPVPTHEEVFPGIVRLPSKPAPISPRRQRSATVGGTNLSGYQIIAP